MTDAQSFIVVTTLATLISSVTAIITILVNRKLAIAERRAATAEIIERARAEAEALLIATDAKAQVIRLEVQTVAERIRLDALRAAALVREEQRVSSEMLADRLIEVKHAADEAFHEANGVKMLLSQDKKEAREETGQKLDAIQGTADDIEKKVDDLGAVQK